MSKDIRGFFFGSKPAAKEAPTKAEKKAESAKPNVDDDIFIVDSDEEKPQAQRKRLKTFKDQQLGSPASRKRPAADNSVNERKSPSPRKSSRVANQQSPALQLESKSKLSSPSAAKKEDASILPVLSTTNLVSPTKKVKEIKGGASAFFGGGTTSSNDSDNLNKGLALENGRSFLQSPLRPLPPPEKAPVVQNVIKSVSEAIDSPPPTKAAIALTSPPSSAKAKAPAKKAVTKKEKEEIGEDSSGGLPSLCFEGQKIAVTGVMEGGCSREGLEDLILQHGGKVAAAVSGKTNYLVAGHLLEDGRPACESSKYKAAVEKNIPIISEADFLDKISAHQEKLAKSAAVAAPFISESQMSAASSFSSSWTQPSSGVTTQGTTLTSHGSSSSYGAGYGSSSGSKALNGFGAVAGSSSSSSSFSSSSSAAPQKSSSSSAPGADLLWVDKYKPASSAHMIGSTELVNKLTRWLQHWDAVHLLKTEKAQFSKENACARAVLLSGPPGIGKSTVAALAAKEGGYDVMELNASDTRNRKEVEAQLSSAVSCRAISGSGQVAGKKRLVVMDEVDGMGGSDRGGIAELIKVIKTSKVPIICICNDRQSTKIRSLVNHCYDLKVRRPTKQQIAGRLVSIARDEGMQLEQNAAEMLVEQVGNDIRQSLNTMQMWKASSNSMNFLEVKAGMNRIEKDKILRLSPFDACGSILGGNKTSFDDRYNAFFIDYSLTPLLIQQNYVDSAKNGIFRNPALDDVRRMEMLAQASDAVSDSDLAAAAIRGQNMHWELLTTQAVFCVRAGAYVQGFQAFPGFPAWLGKNSSANKMARLTKEIVHHTALSIGQGFQPIRLDYVPYLRQSLLRKVQQLQEGTSDVAEVVDDLDAYGLTKEDFMENMKELQMVIENDKVLKDHYGSIDSKVKTSLTKAYNNASHRSQVLVSELAAKSTKKGKGGRGGGGGAGGDLDEETAGLLGEDALDELALLAPAEDDGEDDGDEDISALLAKSKKPSAAAAKKASAAGKAAAGGAGAGAGKGKAKGGKAGGK